MNHPASQPQASNHEHLQAIQAVEVEFLGQPGGIARSSEGIAE